MDKSKWIHPVGEGATCGMTLREHYAGLAMQGLLAKGVAYYRGYSLIEASVVTSDALIRELEK